MDSCCARDDSWPGGFDLCKSSAFVELVPIVALAVTTFASSIVVLPLPPIVELAVVTSSIVVEVVAVVVVVVPRASREAGPVFFGSGRQLH